MGKFGTVDWFACMLVFIGALNWGLIGIFDYNVVHALFGAGTVLTKVTYVLIGFSAVYFAFGKTALSK